jgi:diaminopimelate decarboxylase
VNHFERRSGALFAEDVPLATVAARFGTPTYVYSRATIERHVGALMAGLAGLRHHLCYAVKANGSLGILELLAGLGCDFDAVSLGELARVLAVGVTPARVIVSGVGKRDDEIAAALRARVRYLAVESESELAAVARVAASLGLRAPVALRVNPDVDAKTHPYIATGLKENKFGVPLAAAPALYAEAARSPHLHPVAVTCHIGSQVTELAPFRDAATRMAAIAKDLLAAGVPLQYIGMGGGLGIPYDHEQPPAPDVYGAELTTILGPLGLTLVLEPGRVIVGNAGVLLSRVVRTKAGAERDFVILDAGMNDLLRPALYDAFHAIEPVEAPKGGEALVDVVGPVCESADRFAAGRSLPHLDEGDLVIVRSAGAYGFSMSSNYNGRPRPAEVLCSGATMTLLRERESLTDLWRGEHRLDGSKAANMLAELLA